MAQLESQGQYVFTAPSVDVGLKATAGRFLFEWVIGPEDTSPVEIAAQTAFREHYVQPYVYDAEALQSMCCE